MRLPGYLLVETLTLVEYGVWVVFLGLIGCLLRFAFDFFHCALNFVT